ncbi:ribosomal protein S21 [Acrasis kona]|uniref:40S ribosomal protein S21 n=1 Tax=Acrasis kona TaxID=1008807 RepID=A0AAW2YYR9_9EUKA
MLNDEEKLVDLYIPRKCTATKNLIKAKDHSSVQINVGLVDASGVYTGEFETVAFCGEIRENAKSDDAFNRYAINNGLMKDL